MAEREDWNGLLAERHDPTDAVRLALVAGAPGGSWSSPIRVVGSDGRDYFAKFPEACHQPEDRPSVAIEQIVARLGGLIGAAMVDVTLLEIPDEFIGQELAAGAPVISSRYVHASLALEHCDEQDRPQLGISRAR